jgi:hypothetical protein
MCTCVTALAILAILAISEIIETSTGAEMLKTEMHKTAKVCQKALFSKNVILTSNLLIISLLFVK